MNQELPKYNLQKLNPIERRLAKELAAVHEVCEKNEFISYEVLDPDYSKRPPRKYRIHYNIKSFTGIDPNGNPVVGDHHTVDLEIPKHYPLESVMPYAKTDIWHPNIKWDGPYKGHICGNVKDFGKTYTLDLMILRISTIIEYKNYLAENIPPFPEEEKVAKWVREYAEPVGFLNSEEGIVWDKIPTEAVNLEQATTEESEVPTEAATETETVEETAPDAVATEAQAAETPEETPEGEGDGSGFIKISLKGGKKPKTTPPPSKKPTGLGGFINIKPK